MSDVGSYLSDYIYDYVSKVAKANADKSYDVTGTVTRIEDGVAFIQFENSSIETPVEQTISVKPGDNVKVRVSGRKAWVVGNSTVPPTGDAKAIEAATEAGLAKIEAAAAQKVADVAEEKAATAIEAATTGVDNKLSAYDSAVQEFTNLMANAYGMYRSEISDPINPGANVYALHNNSTYEASTFAMLLNSNGLYVLNRDTASDPWTIVSASASDGAALVKSITANSAIIDELLSNDVTVTGALHSSDYIPAAHGADPPYSQAGMGLDFGEKEFEAENFAIDRKGRMYASEGYIGKWQIIDNYLLSEAERLYTAYEKSQEESIWRQWYPDWTCPDTYRVRVRIYPPEAWPLDVPVNVSPIILVEKQMWHDPSQGEGDGPELEWTEKFFIDTDGNILFNGGELWNRRMWLENGYTSYAMPTSLSDTLAENNFKAFASNGAPSFRARRTDTGADVSLAVGTAGHNHGVYSATLSKWMLYGDDSNAYFNGIIDSAARLAFAKSLTQEDVGTSATHFVTLTYNWGKFGYTTLAQARSILNVFPNTTTAGSNSFIIDSDGSTAYRFMFTNAGNLRLDTSTDGGVNWTTKKYALWNNQTGIKELYSGTFKSGSAAATFSRNYDFYIIYGSSGGGARESVVVPKVCIGTSNTAFLISDDETWLSVNLKYSGSTITMTWKENKKTGGTTLTSGFINRVYGVNGLI